LDSYEEGGNKYDLFIIIAESLSIFNSSDGVVIVKILLCDLLISNALRSSSHPCKLVE